MNWLWKNIKELGLATLFTALVVSIVWIVNLNRDIADFKEKIVTLKVEKVDETRTRLIVREELADVKSDLRDVKMWIMQTQKLQTN